jgi:serine/threonine-protein phosphatase 2A regulatory subunit B'
MKSLMKGVKKRLTSESWEKEGKDQSGAPASPITTQGLNSPNSTSNQPQSPNPALSSTQNSASVTVDSSSALPRCRVSRSVGRDVIVHNLPALRDATPANRKALLLKKLRLCSFIFTFDDAVVDTPADQKDKEVKRNALLELVNYLTVFKPSFAEDELIAIFDMLSANLFRPLPPSTYESTGTYNPEEDEPSSESTWPHLQVVYEFLLRLATSTETDQKLMDKFFSRKFILNLLELFDSEDPRERDYLKTILHRIYGNFMSLRPFIRRAINNVFYKFIYETDRHNGIAELLEILGSIINGFALPLKEQHKQFLVRVLLPLHKVTHVSVFHPQLSYCVTQFLEKDQTLAPNVVMSVLKFWPLTCSKKELMFLNELEEILDRIQSHHLANAQMPLFRQIAHSINSPHFQVSERAIYVLNNDIIVRFITGNREILVPILAKALFSNTLNKDNNSPTSPSNTDKNGVKKLESNPKSPTNNSSADTPRPNRLRSASSTEGGEAKEGEADSIINPPRHGGHGAHGKPGHWNATIVELTQDIIKLFNEMDSGLMLRCSQQHQDMIANAEWLEKKKKWDDLVREHRAAQAELTKSINAIDSTNSTASAQMLTSPINS